jgi:hypothetical protein
MKYILILLLIPMYSIGQTEDSIYLGGPIGPTNIIYPVDTFTNIFTPTVEVNPVYACDFAIWAFKNFLLRINKDGGRYWNMRYDPTGTVFTDEKIFQLFNKSYSKKSPPCSPPKKKRRRSYHCCTPRPIF